MGASLKFRRRRQAEGLSIREIRFLLVEKRRAWCHSPMEHFHLTGRILPIANEGAQLEIVQLRSTFQKLKITSPRSWLDHFFLLFEILAIASLLAIVENGLLTLKELNQNVSSAMQQPAFVPTPLIREVILPGG
jgi:hypothetical protein